MDQHVLFTCIDRFFMSSLLSTLLIAPDVGHILDQLRQYPVRPSELSL